MSRIKTPDNGRPRILENPDTPPEESPVVKASGLVRDDEGSEMRIRLSYLDAAVRQEAAKCKAFDNLTSQTSASTQAVDECVRRHDTRRLTGSRAATLAAL